MSLRNKILSPVALLVLVGLCLGTAASVTAQVSRLTVTNHGDMEPVSFDHTDHAERLYCDDCHHPDRSDGTHRCGACHSAGKYSRAQLSLEAAAHDSGVGKCWSCHLKEKAKRPLECEDCHAG